MPRQEEVVVLGLERGHGRGGGWHTARSAGQAAAKGIDGFGRPRPLVSLVSSGGSGYASAASQARMLCLIIFDSGDQRQKDPQKSPSNGNG